MKMPCVLCKLPMTSFKNLKEIQRKNFEEFDKEESPATKNHRVACAMPCCNHLVCINHFKTIGQEFSPCPFCLTPFHTRSFLDQLKEQTQLERVQAQIKRSVDAFHRTKQPDCGGCLYCPQIEGRNVIYPHENKIMVQWMGLFFTGKVTYLQLNNNTMRLVDFLLEENLLKFDDHTKKYFVRFYDDIPGQDYEASVAMEERGEKLLEQFWVDLEFDGLDRVIQKYSRAAPGFKRWNRRKVMFLIRYRGDPGQVWSVLSFANGELFRAITKFL